jgi:hypothetical protein
LKKLSHINPEVIDRVHEAPPSETGGIISHLRDCDSCAERYVQQAMKSVARKITAPGAIWAGIQAKLQGRESYGSTRNTLSPRRQIALFAAMALLLVGFVISARLAYHGRTPEVSLDLGLYVAALEKASVAPSAENLQQTFSTFVSYDRQAALRETGLRPQVEGYRLTEQRFLHTRNANIVELVYSSAEDSFVMFVATRSAKFSFGRYHLLDAVLEGLQCRRVQCPRQDIFWSTTDEQQYVFIRQRTSPDQSGRLFKKLITKGL